MPIKFGKFQVKKHYLLVLLLLTLPPHKLMVSLPSSFLIYYKPTISNGNQ